MISICIPVYIMNGHGGIMLTQLLNTIVRQQINYDYEIVISDSDTSGVLKEVYKRYTMLPIRSEFNPRYGAAENMNNSLNMAKGEFIKLMCMDDMFYSVNAINLFVEALHRDGWVISNSVRIRQDNKIYAHHIASYKHGDFTKNITGMPSVVGWRNCDIRFDERLKTVVDMYFYHQLYKKYGQPGHIREYAIAQRYWAGSLSHTQPRRHQEEVKFLIQNNLI